VFLDIMHSFNGYQTCYYRTFCCGEPSDAQVEAYHTAWDWLETAIDAVEPGATTRDIAETFPPAEEFGFESEEEAFLLQYGHGIGLGLWEMPVISRMFSLEHPYEIREGMVFALETWAPVEGGEGAARIEEEVVVTEDGAEPLFKFPADELIATGESWRETY
jgi:Xaa-Pro dipeptidase